ncbi:hypothetical protein [Peribacillus simplex]|uniref:hypothetical protein n=1 Tax=Peribacillus simplex TaxID=1478 RepID=UPI0036735C78
MPIRRMPDSLSEKRKVKALVILQCLGNKDIAARSFDWLGYALDSTGRFPEVVKALIISDATRWAAVVSMEESERKFLNRLQSIET